MYSRAVWQEKTRAEEGVVPSSWIQEGEVLWPPVVNAWKPLQECREPVPKKWKHFPLIKIKTTSGTLTCNRLYWAVKSYGPVEFI